MPRFKNTEYNSSMSLEVCDFFEPKDRKADNICKYFTGNRDNEKETEGCRRYCRIHEAKTIMEEGQQVFKRVKGALRKK